MVAMVSPRFTRSLVSTIHAVTLCRRSGLLSCLRTWPPDLADMAGTRPLVVTMSLSTVPHVDCKCAAAAAGPSSGYEWTYSINARPTERYHRASPPRPKRPCSVLLSLEDRVETETARRSRGGRGRGGGRCGQVGARHPVLAATPLPLVAQPGGDLVDPLHVRRVQVAAVLVARGDVQPTKR